MRGPDCRACCMSEHGAEDGCDQCPFEIAGERANFVLKVFRLACAKHTDQKSRTSRWYMDTDRMLFAYATYDIENKERVFQLVSLALQVLNGEDEIIITDDDQLLE
mgnify:CR=1 FL=1